MCQSGRAYVLVEGQGDVLAVGNLLARLSSDQGATLAWSTPVRWPNLHLEQGLRRGAEFVRSKKDVRGLLVLRDEDDACPRHRGPEMANWLRALGLPFPSAVVLLHPEYEVVFLPCLDLMAGEQLGGRPGLDPGAVWDGETWEARRGVKEWVVSSLSAQPTLQADARPTADDSDGGLRPAAESRGAVLRDAGEGRELFLSGARKCGGCVPFSDSV